MSSSSKLKKHRYKQLSVNPHCFYCGRNMIAPHSRESVDNGELVATIEHRLYPQSKGGTNDPFNIVLACARCNNLRGDIAYAIFEPFANTVLRQYPNAPTIVLRKALRHFIETMAELAVKHHKHQRNAISVALLYIDDKLKER